jgi:T-complex protein 1 subunit eta
MNRLQPGIILLREGTDTSQGTPQMVSNINACCTVAEIVATTLGPRGMDKLIYNANGSQSTVSNDGATVMKMLDIVHPAARTLVDIAKSQDNEVGDGTTSVVLLAASLMREAKRFLDDGVHAQTIVKGFRGACDEARSVIGRVAVDLGESKSAEEFALMLARCAATSMNSKLLAHNREFFAKMAVDAVMRLDDDMDIDLIGIKKETGGSLDESSLVEGVAFRKCFSYAGFEQQPKRFESPLILALNIELELKSERDNAELRIEDPDNYQSLVDAEWKIIYRKLDAMIEAGAKIILSRLPIGDLATQYFADRDVFCAGRVAQADLERVAKATGARIQTTVEKLQPDALGTCALFEERQVGKERYNFFTGCVKARAATIILRGGGEQFTAEAERSLHDALMVVRRARKHHTVVAGGGAIEMLLAQHLKRVALTIDGTEQLMYIAFARALEAIPHQIASNAGFDATDILNKLRHVHNKEEAVAVTAAVAAAASSDAADVDIKPCWYGVDIDTGGIVNTFETFVWEPSLVRLNAITAATEAANLILSIDETVRNPASQQQ